MSNSYYVLKIQYANKPAETRNISSTVTVLGREAGDIVLGDPQSSGRHAEIHFQNGTVTVKDLGSTNGTYFNGVRNPQFTLSAGHSFSIGQTVMTLMAVHGGAPAKGPAKTMIAMGGMPPMPPRPQAGPGAPAPSPMGAPPPAAPPPASPMGAPAPAPSPMGAPAPAASPMGAPAPAPSPMGAPAPGPSPMGAPAPGPGPGGYGAPAGGAPGGPMGPGPGGPGGPMGPGGGPPAPMGQPAPAPMGAAAAGGMAASFGQPPAPAGQPGGYGAQPVPAAGASGQVSLRFTGTGGEVFGQLFVGGLLTVITLYIYFPWFMCSLINYVCSRLEINGGKHGKLKMSFTGTGGELFVHGLVGALLTVVTLYIYTPWFVCRLLRWFGDNIELRAEDGTVYNLKFEGTGGQLFGKAILGAILTVITLYIYMPWFLVDVGRWIRQHTKVTQNGQEIGQLDFEGTGGQFFGTIIIGGLLTVITLYIYYPWLKASLTKFWWNNTVIKLNDRTVKPEFDGTGGELFVIYLLFVLLAPLTIYIYTFWFIAQYLGWNYNNLTFNVQGGGGGQAAMPPGPGAPGAPGGYPQQPMMGGAPGQPAMGPGPGGYA